MGLPDSRDLTATDGVSQLPAATLNALQDNEVDLWDAVRGSGFIFEDDFRGSAIDLSKWASDPGVASQDFMSWDRKTASKRFYLW